MNDQQRTVWGKVLITTAAGCLLLSTPCLLGAVLAHLGVLADVGPTENQQMGQQILRMAVYPLGVGVLLLVAWLVVRRRAPKA
jgi:cytochrome c biogenesis protein CcdA